MPSVLLWCSACTSCCVPCCKACAFNLSFSAANRSLMWRLRSLEMYSRTAWVVDTCYLPFRMPLATCPAKMLNHTTCRLTSGLLPRCFPRRWTIHQSICSIEPWMGTEGTCGSAFAQIALCVQHHLPSLWTWCATVRSHSFFLAAGNLDPHRALQLTRAKHL